MMMMKEPKVIKNPVRMKKELEKWRKKGGKIGFVPTMGALHNGHLSLIKKAREENDIVVVSIFVNPTQFGPNEDYEKYPRPFKDDFSMCKEEKVDYIFNPDVKDIYPEGYLTYVEVQDLSDILCGQYRPGHFRGVATIVLKLFNIIQPTIAYFGLKDYQQYVIINKMVKDLNLDVKIKGLPIVREKDGLALSSRNQYLSEEERRDALLLYKSLVQAKELIESGEYNTRKVIKHMYRILLSGQLIKKKNIDYIEIVDKNSLKSLSYIEKECIILLAVWIGKARLIDNMEVKVK